MSAITSDITSALLLNSVVHCHRIILIMALTKNYISSPIIILLFFNEMFDLSNLYDIINIDI